MTNAAGQARLSVNLRAQPFLPFPLKPSTQPPHLIASRCRSQAPAAHAIPAGVPLQAAPCCCHPKTAASHLPMRATSMRCPLLRIPGSRLPRSGAEEDEGCTSRNVDPKAYSLTLPRETWQELSCRRALRQSLNTTRAEPERMSNPRIPRSGAHFRCPTPPTQNENTRKRAR